MTKYGKQFPSIVNQGNVYGVQFHPESVLSLNGYRIISSFLSECGYKILEENQFKILEQKLVGHIKWVVKIPLNP